MNKSMMVAGAVLAMTMSSHVTRAQDAENGEQVFRQCRACHQIGDGAKNLVGPQLNGIVGRKPAGVDGFAYSQASKDAVAKGVVWDEATLLKYLEAPQAFMPGTKMSYAGLKDEGDRKDVIAYLMKFK